MWLRPLSAFIYRVVGSSFIPLISPQNKEQHQQEQLPCEMKIRPSKSSFPPPNENSTKQIHTYFPLKGQIVPLIKAFLNFYLKIVIFCTFSGDFFAIFKLFVGRVLKREKRENFNFLCFGLPETSLLSVLKLVFCCRLFCTRDYFFGLFYRLWGVFLLCWDRFKNSVSHETRNIVLV